MVLLKHWSTDILQGFTHLNIHSIFKTLIIYFRTQWIKFRPFPLKLTFWFWNWNIPVEISWYHGCWCLGSVCCQVISNHGTDYAWQSSSCLPWGTIRTPCTILILSNDKTLQLFSFLEINSWQAGFNLQTYPYPWPVELFESLTAGSLAQNKTEK